MKTNTKLKIDYENMGIVFLFAGIISSILNISVEYYYTLKHYYYTGYSFFEYQLIIFCVIFTGIAILSIGLYQDNKEWKVYIRKNDLFIQEMKRRKEEMDKVIAILEAEQFLATLILRKVKLMSIIAKRIN